MPLNNRKTIKNRRTLVEAGWDSAHCVAFFVAPKIMVRHFEIRPTVQKLALIEVSKALRLEMTVKRSKIVVRMS